MFTNTTIVLYMSQYKKRILVTCFPGVLLILGVIILTSLDTLSSSVIGLERLAFFNSHLTSLFFKISLYVLY